MKTITKEQAIENGKRIKDKKTTILPAIGGLLLIVAIVFSIFYIVYYAKRNDALNAILVGGLVPLLIFGGGILFIIIPTRKKYDYLELGSKAFADEINSDIRSINADIKKEGKEHAKRYNRKYYTVDLVEYKLRWEDVYFELNNKGSYSFNKAILKNYITTDLYENKDAIKEEQEKLADYELWELLDGDD